MLWQAIYMENLFLNHMKGGNLRANGRYRRWNNGVSVDHIDDINNISTMMHWVMEVIPAREIMPRLPRPSPVSPPCLLLDSSRICANWVLEYR